jgi:hypothetical protein
VTPSEFKGCFPDGDFDALGSDYIQPFLDAAATHFDVARWGRKYSEGIAFYVAHKIVIGKARKDAGMKVDSGNVSEKHVGPVGMSMNGEILVKQADDPFLLTSYGREYAALRDRVGLGGAVGQ